MRHASQFHLLFLHVSKMLQNIRTTSLPFPQWSNPPTLESSLVHNAENLFSEIPIIPLRPLCLTNHIPPTTWTKSLSTGILDGPRQKQPVTSLCATFIKLPYPLRRAASLTPKMKPFFPDLKTSVYITSPQQQPHTMHTRTMATLQELPTDPSSRLRKALQLPLANSKIAEWLFSHSRNAFHRDATPLAPGSFNDSLMLFVRQTIGGVDTPPIHVLLLPVAIIDGIAVGYTLTKGDISDSRLHPFTHPARETTGRFAFDPLSSHIIGVAHGVNDVETGIYAVLWYRGNRRQRCYFSVPKREYSFENPPQEVLSMTIKNERKTGSTRAKSSAVNDDDTDTGCSIGDFEKIHPNVLFDFARPKRRRVEKESGFEFRRLGGSGKLEKGSVQRWLREIESCLEGRFYSPGVRRFGGGVTEEVTTCMFAKDPGEDDARLKMKAAREYYASVLPV